MRSRGSTQAEQFVLFKPETFERRLRDRLEHAFRQHLATRDVPGQGASGGDVIRAGRVVSKRRRRDQLRLQPLYFMLVDVGDRERIAFFERRWSYLGGFGLPITLATYSESCASFNLTRGLVLHCVGAYLWPPHASRILELATRLLPCCVQIVAN